VQDVAGALNILLADMLALHLKATSFHWHISGPAAPEEGTDMDTLDKAA
jgi:DNA-binding ferritin-like protein